MSTSTVNTTKNIQVGRIFDTAVTALKARCRTILQRVSLTYDIYGERRAMRQLSDDALKDLGITRAQLNEECSRGITKLPANRDN